MVVVQLRPQPARPMGWLGSIGARPRRRMQGNTAAWVIGGLLALALLVGGTAATVAARPAAPPALTCGTKGTAGGLSAEQRGNATRIVAVGRAMGIPPRGQVVAVATAMQESSLVNNSGGDRDSAGLFQQRPSQGWGTYSQVTNPNYAAATFYRHLKALPGWESMPVTEAAQTIQRSAYPDAYAKHVPTALALVGGTACTKT